VNWTSKHALRLGVASFWGVALVAAFVTTLPRPWLLTIVGVGLGCWSGHLRSQAAATGRAARMANVLGWVCGIGLMVLAMAVAENMFVGAWAASFAGYLFADRVYLLLAIYRRERWAAERVTNSA
jgi:hypothetical protein